MIKKKKNSIQTELTWLTHDLGYKDQIWYKNKKNHNHQKLKNKTNNNKIARIKYDIKNN
jgi:hypothetical protein